VGQGILEPMHHDVDRDMRDRCSVMEAVVRSDDMRAFDLASPVPIPALIERAGAAVAHEAINMLGGTYGRRVILLAGSGNNGADGRAAAVRLERRGVRVHTIEVNRYRSVPERIEECDLVIDAVVGTGFTGQFSAPNVAGALVLAVDIPSGVDGLTGLVRVQNSAFRADRTVTFAAWKPGLLFGRGPEFSGVVKVIDIGLPVTSSVHVLNLQTARNRLPQRPLNDHKWKSAVFVIGGSVGMTGAPRLATAAAMRCGSGMVRVGIPGDTDVSGSEAVGVHLPGDGWANAALLQTERCRAIVLGPGLGRSRIAMQGVRAVLSHATSIPIVLDGDGLAALSASPHHDDPNGLPQSRPGADDELRVQEAKSPAQRAIYEANNRRALPLITARPAEPIATVRNLDSAFDSAQKALQHRRSETTILTPHDGEYERITGKPVGADRMRAAQQLAVATRSIVLLKGPTTVVAAPNGRTELICNGDQRLATAGSGDVLSGIIASLLAQGLSPFEAAATGAFLHGEAANCCASHGVIASDLVAALPTAWKRVSAHA
jgi:ADP-dependent NAD(P)H-hydrate dehydratase / NAD(P)H-hydrate epimerase